MIGLWMLNVRAGVVAVLLDLLGLDGFCCW